MIRSTLEKLITEEATRPPWISVVMAATLLMAFSESLSLAKIVIWTAIVSINARSSGETGGLGGVVVDVRKTSRMHICAGINHCTSPVMASQEMAAMVLHCGPISALLPLRFLIKPIVA